MRKGPTEDEFLRQVLQLARLCGWRTAHFRPAMTKSGRWVTAVQGDGKGFPDLICTRGGLIFAAELKSETGTITPEQIEWVAALQAAKVPCFVWRPKDWPDIERLLK